LIDKNLDRWIQHCFKFRFVFDQKK